RIGRMQRELAQALVPILAHTLELALDCSRLGHGVAQATTLDPCIADPQHEYPAHRLPGLELENAVQSSARRAPDGDAPPTTAALHGDGLPLVAVRTDKDLAIRIEAFHGQRAGKVRLRLLERPEADRVIDDTV